MSWTYGEELNWCGARRGEAPNVFDTLGKSPGSSNAPTSAPDVS